MLWVLCQKCAGGAMKKSGAMSREEAVEILKQLAKPIDFEGLERKGLLIKKGRRYFTPNLHKLPEHVAQKITSSATAGSGGGCYLTFARSIQSRSEKLLIKAAKARRAT
jgi:hypothetical protein